MKIFAIKEGHTYEGAGHERRTVFQIAGNSVYYRTPFAFVSCALWRFAEWAKRDVTEEKYETYSF